MRVLILTVSLPSSEKPGTMAPLARQIQSLRDLGVDIDVLEIEGTPKLKYLRALPALWARAGTADLVHGHYGYCGWLARAQLGKPVVVSFMGSDLLGTPDETGRVPPLSELSIRVNRWLAGRVASVIVKSSEMAGVVAPVRSHIVPNGVDLETFQPMNRKRVRAELGWHENALYILFPGNPDNPRKGFSLAREAVAKAAARMSTPVELIPLRNVPPDRVALYMNGSDAVVMTSLKEGSPNVVKEAMACNAPIVSVEVGDVVELLQGVEGCVICPREAGAIADALVEMVTRGRPSDGRAALRRRGLDQESVATTIVKIYEEILARGRAG